MLRFAISGNNQALIPAEINQDIAHFRPIVPGSGHVSDNFHFVEGGVHAIQRAAQLGGDV